MFGLGKPFQHSLFLWAMTGAYPKKEHMKKGVSLGQAPALRANTKQSWKGLPGTNTLAYLENLKHSAI